MESSYRIVRETSVYPCQQETYPRRLNAMPAPVRRMTATRPPIRPSMPPSRTTPASTDAAKRRVRVLSVRMLLIVFLSLAGANPVWIRPLWVCFARPVEDGKRPHTGGCGMVGVQRVESGDFHRGRPVFARLQTELVYRFRRTADGNGRLRFLQRTCKIG